MKQQFRKILSLTTAAVLTLGMVVTAHAADSGMTRGEMAKLLVEGAGLSGQAAGMPPRPAPSRTSPKAAPMRATSILLMTRA